MEYAAVKSILLRGGPAIRKRALAVIYALMKGKHRDEFCIDDCLAILVFLLRSSRFVFACGGKGVVIRSGDRCKTWRALQLPAAGQPLEPTEAPGDNKVTKESEEETDEKAMEEILNLIPPKDETGGATDEDDEPTAVKRKAVAVPVVSAVKEIKEKRRKGSSRGVPELLGVACLEDMVLVVGECGYMAYSVNRGQSFTFIPVVLPAHNSSKMDVYGPVFLSKYLALAYSSNLLFGIRFAEGSAVSVEVLQTISPGVIGGIYLRTSPIQKMSYFAVLGKNFICFSNFQTSGMKTEIGAFHRLAQGVGLLRALVDVPASDPALQADLNSAVKERNELEVKMNKVSANKGNALGAAASSKKYSYGAVTVVQDAQAIQEIQSILLDDASIAIASSQSRIFAAMATEGPISTYDCVSLIALICTEKEKDLLVTSIVLRLVHLPFVLSRAVDPVGLVCRIGPSGAPTLVQSTTAGICVSYDLGKTWKEPVQAYTGNLVLMKDNATIIAANLKKSVVISDDGGDEWKLVPIPLNLNMPTINHIAVMQ